MATCYKRLSFSNDEEYQLIQFIEEHPALWDASNAEYGNTELRKKYWINIATELNKTVLECRRKWRFIRDYYIHKRRRICDSTPERDGKYYSLQFLNKVKVSTKKNSHLNNLEQQNSKSILPKSNTQKNKRVEQEFNDSDDIDYNPLTDANKSTYEKVTVERMDQDQNFLSDVDDKLSNQYNDINDDTTEEVVSNRLYELEDDLKNEEIISTCEENEEEYLTVTSNEHDFHHSHAANDNDLVIMHEQAIDLFFQSMAATVKTFPRQFVAEAKLKVFTAVNEMETKVYNFLLTET